MKAFSSDGAGFFGSRSTINRYYFMARELRWVNIVKTRFLKFFFFIIKPESEPVISTVCFEHNCFIKNEILRS